MVGHRLQCSEACRAVTAQPDRPLCPEVQVRSVRQTAGSGNGCPRRPPYGRRRRRQGPMRVARKRKPEGSGRVPCIARCPPLPVGKTVYHAKPKMAFRRSDKEPPMEIAAHHIDFLIVYGKMEIRKVFEEHISGAKKNDERPVLCEAIQFCKDNRIYVLLVSELSRLGRNAFEVLASVKDLLDCGINLYIQKEQFSLLDKDGKPSLFAPVMIATLSTCAQLERNNISFRLNSGRKQYIAKGGKLGRKVGSVKTSDQKREEYKEVINLLRKGYAIRDVAKLTGRGVSTVQRVKKDFLT